MWDCYADIKTIRPFFLCCQFFANEKNNLNYDLDLIDPSVESLNVESLLNTLLFDSDTLCEKCPNAEFFLVRIFPHLD